MHGCSSGTSLLVNAEVDSMGGVADGGVGIDTKTSPRQEAIEKAQAELMQEYDVREERRRELEFLEKGGNPLDFKFGQACFLNVQSTSLANQHPEQFVASEAKGSFEHTASAHGDSVESIGKPEVPAVSEHNTADSLLLFDGDNESRDGERNSLHPSWSTFAPSEQSSQMDGTKNAIESEDSGVVWKNQAYARRNRFKSNRDIARSSSCGHGSSPSVHQALSDPKVLRVETNSQKGHKVSNCNTKSSGPNDDVVCQTVKADSPLDMELDTDVATCGASDGKLDVVALGNLQDKQNNQQFEVDFQTTPDSDGGVPDLCGDQEQVVSVGLDCQPSAATMNNDNQISSAQLNGFRKLKRGRKSMRIEGTKGLDSQSPCTSVSLDGNNDSDPCTNTSENPKEQFITFERTTDLEGGELVKEKNDSKTTEELKSVHQDQSGNSCIVKVEKDVIGSRPDSKSIVRHIEVVKLDDHIVSKNDTLSVNLLHDSDSSKLELEKLCTDRHDISNASTFCEPCETALPERASTFLPEIHTCSENYSSLTKKEHEDSILEEAQIIQTKRKRIAQLSVGSLPFKFCGKSQWDFVLEEMSWLANDFMQERMWKMTAAAQICHRVAFASYLKFEKEDPCQRQKRVAHSLAKAVMQFWHSAELLLTREAPSDHLKGANGNEVAEDRIDDSNMMLEQSNGLKVQNHAKNLAVERYAVGFLKNNRFHVSVQTEAPETPNRVTDSSILEMSWENRLTEESLFYTVSPGAMETYHKSIESHLGQSEKTGSSMQEEVETSVFDAGAAASQDNICEEDDGGTSIYYLCGAVEHSSLPKFAQKKRKNTARPIELGVEMLNEHCSQNKTWNQQSGLLGRPTNSINVGSIPTKRIRTASRQRVLSPSGVGNGEDFQVQAKPTASSGDTNSLQDDQSTLHGGYQMQKMEVELMDFEKPLRVDCTEISKPKKKSKHVRDHLKWRLESHQFESNGRHGLFGQHTIKKPRIVKHSLDNSFDMGSIPSPVVSQISNMSNSSKFIKMIGGRDRGKKLKVLKIRSGQPGSGSQWSLFEDQALIVLVHDLGPHWELVSDCINKGLQFKCIFRKPQECKERHKILMDRTTGDGADSAEDSGSSQPYPSTLPGIPKGSARQLFQCLQGSVEEDTLKAHFEKIISIVQLKHYQKNQNDKQDLKQIAPVHDSHILVLSQVYPNNLNRAPLTPLDLIDTTTSSGEVPSPGYQGSHNSSLAISTQGPVASPLLAADANSSLQGSSSMVLGGNLSLPSSPLNGSIRDAMYGVPKATSLPADEQQRVQQYNHTLPGRNIPRSSSSIPGAVSVANRGVRMRPGGNGTGMMCGANKGMPMSRPGLQGIASSSMSNTGSMLSSGMIGVPSSVDLHSIAGSSPGNSMLKPCEAMHMMQVTRGKNHGVLPSGGLSSGFANQSIPSPVHSCEAHSPQQHQLSPQQQSHVLSKPHLQGPIHAAVTQQQAYAVRVSKERHMQQGMLQPQQQLAASNALMPQVQPQSQIPISSPLPNSSQIQSQASSQPPPSPTPSSPMTHISSQHQQKHHLPPHGLGHNPQTGASGLPNHIMEKQRMRQFQGVAKHHPQQRESSQSQSRAKLLKGIGKGNLLMHQTLPIDPSRLNGFITKAPGGHTTDKGEQVMQLMQGQVLYSGPALNSFQPAKPLVPQCSNKSQPQEKLYAGGAPPLSNQLSHLPLSENKNQGQVSSSGYALSTSHQAVPPPPLASNHQQMQPHSQPQLQKQIGQSQSTVHRMLQQNHRASPDSLSKSQTDPQPVMNLSSVGTSTEMPHVCIDSVVSSTGAPPREAPEPLYEAGFPNSAAQSSSSSSICLTNSAGSETLASISQGLGHRQSSDSLSPHRRNIGAQWQAQLRKHSPPMPPPQQQQEQSQQQQSPQQL